MVKTCVQAQIIKQNRIAQDVLALVVAAPEIAAITKPGQFVHIRVADMIDPLLRRPFSIADCDSKAGTLTIIYRVVGRGTAIMAKLQAGDYLDCMGPLGQGFDLKARRPLLIGGGMGLAPLVMLAKAFCSCPATVLMGGRNEQELYWTDIYAGVCRNIHITTDDGSVGRRGFTVDVLPELLSHNQFDFIYACGPHAMLKGVAMTAVQHDIPCQVSLEDFMACGVGACLSCTCAGTDGKRHKICTDGPVFWAGEVAW